MPRGQSRTTFITFDKLQKSASQEPEKCHHRSQSWRATVAAAEKQKQSWQGGLWTTPSSASCPPTSRRSEPSLRNKQGKLRGPRAQLWEFAKPRCRSSSSSTWHIKASLFPWQPVPVPSPTAVCVYIASLPGIPPQLSRDISNYVLVRTEPAIRKMCLVSNYFFFFFAFFLLLHFAMSETQETLVPPPQPSRHATTYYSRRCLPWNIALLLRIGLSVHEMLGKWKSGRTHVR